MDAKDECDGITKYSYKPDTLYGKEFLYNEFNKTEAYIIRIRKSYNATESKNKLIHMLETLLSNKKADEVKQILSKEHGMIMNIEDDNEEVNNHKDIKKYQPHEFISLFICIYIHLLVRIKAVRRKLDYFLKLKWIFAHYCHHIIGTIIQNHGDFSWFAFV